MCIVSFENPFYKQSSPYVRPGHDRTCPGVWPGHDREPGTVCWLQPQFHVKLEGSPASQPNRLLDWSVVIHRGDTETSPQSSNNNKTLC